MSISSPCPSIPKLGTPILKVRYSKPYRFPLWLFNKLTYQDPKSVYDKTKIKMCIGHLIELSPQADYLKRVAVSRQYDDENIYIAKKFLSPGDVILDIGANIGLYSCAYAYLYKSLNITVHAVEAVSTSFKQLQHNINLNHLNNIVPHHLALGKEAGQLEFILPSKEFMGNAVGSNILNEEDKDHMQSQDSIKEIIPMMTLDQWAQENNLVNCSFMKIDVEGAEYYVFEGGLNFIKSNRPAIQCEYNDYWMKNISKNLKDIFDFFTPLNYVIFKEEKNRYVLINTPDLNIPFTNLLLVPQEKIPQ